MNFDTAAGQWQAAGLGLLALCLALAGLSDARQRRIPNALVLMTLVAGLLLNAFGPQPFLRNPGLFSPYPGALGIGASLLGALVALLEKASGRTAFSVGKPSPFMMRAARKRIGRSTDETIMVGDTMSTDIRGALELGFHSVLVLTGGTRREELAQSAFHPHRVLESIADLDPLSLRDELLERLAAITA